MRYPLSLAATVAMMLGVGCGGGHGSDAAESAPSKSLSSLQLTDSPPRSLTEACAKVAPRTRLRVVCPPIAPAGRFLVQFVSPDPQAADDTFYEVQGESGSLHRENGDRQNVGHWSFGAATTLAAVERTLQVAPEYVRACERHNERYAAKPKLCKPKISTLSIADTPVKEYLMPEFPFGGINGGHVVLIWQGDDAAYLLSVHDPANRERELVMLDGLLAETT